MWKKCLKLIVFLCLITLIVPASILGAKNLEKHRNTVSDLELHANLQASKGVIVDDTEMLAELSESNSEGDSENTEDSESSEETEEEVLNGLVEVDGEYYYYEQDVMFKGGYKAVQVNGKIYYYYFDKKTGKAYRGGYKAAKIGDKKYYFYFSKKTGRAYTKGLKKIKIDGVNYYFFFKKTGKAVVKDWKTVEGNKYYFGKNGRAYTGYHDISHYLCKFSLSGKLIRKIDKNKKMVALTYDDGPSINTPTILKVLKENNAVATFFVVGNRVPTYSKTVKTAYKQNCEIANHTQDHVILTRATTKKINSQWKKCNKAIKKQIGTKAVVMRPPGGAINSAVKQNVEMPLILWSVDTLDWKTRDSQKTQEAVLTRVKDGDIVLMHDLYEATANASKVIIPQLIDDGYQLVTVSELARCRGVKLKKGKVYNSFRKK